MKKVPLLGSGIYGKSAVVTAQRRVNCYYEFREDGDSHKAVVYGTPGTTIFSSINAGPVRGMHSFTNKLLLFVVTGNALYEVNAAGTATLRGSVTGGTNFVGMADNGTQLIIVDGTKGWIYNTSTLVLAQITSPNFPQNATTVDFDSGYFLVEDPSSIGLWRKSAAYDGLVWAATDSATAESSPDPLITLKVTKGVVLLFGALSLEFWQNVGSVGFPYAPIRAATQAWGLVAKRSIAEVNNQVYFLGKVQDGPPQVVVLDGSTPTRVSTHDLESIMGKFVTVADATAVSYTLEGHPMYQLTFPSAMQSFLFDASTKMWSEVQSGVAVTGRHVAGVGCGFNGHNYVGDFNNGIIYNLDPNAYTDNGASILRLVQSRHVYEDHNVLGLDELYFRMETGVGLESGQGSNPMVMFQVSKDGGQTFGYERTVGFGRVGQYLDHRAVFRRLGAGRDFVFRLKMTDPVKFVVTDGAVTVRFRNQ